MLLKVIVSLFLLFALVQASDVLYNKKEDSNATFVGITRQTVHDRMQSWVDAKVPYSQSAYYGGYRTVQYEMTFPFLNFFLPIVQSRLLCSYLHNNLLYQSTDSSSTILRHPFLSPTLTIFYHFSYIIGLYINTHTHH